jgi:hypothetical protein
MGLRCRDPGLAEPVVEAGLGESGVVAGHECALVQFCAEVARVRIGDHFAWIAAFPEDSSDEFVETELLWPRHFNDAVDRRSYGDLANRTRDILRTGATRTVLPSVASSAILSMNSKNCVAWTIEYLIDDLLIRFSWAILARK